MKHLALLACLLLASCASVEHRFSAACAFGAEHESEAYACAEQNFGEAGAREMAERQVMCAVQCAERPVGSSEAWCAISCGPSMRFELK